MSNTITAFYTFIPGGDGFASEVNNNFGALRGDRIPINSSIGTASDLTHKLGETDHRWNNSYIKRVLFSDQTTSGLYVEGATDAASIDFYAGDTLAADIYPRGRHTFQVMTTISFQVLTSTAQQIPGLILSISTNGLPTMIGLNPGLTPAIPARVFSQALTTTVNQILTTVNILRDSTTISSFNLGLNSGDTTSSLNAINRFSSFFFIDDSTTGNHTYSFQIKISPGSGQAAGQIFNTMAFAHTLYW